MSITQRLVVDTRRPKPDYLQLARQLRERIASGHYAPGDQMPSISYVTGETRLSVQTVRRGLAVLVAEGWAVTVPGRGTGLELGVRALAGRP